MSTLEILLSVAIVAALILAAIGWIKYFLEKRWIRKFYNQHFNENL